MIIVLLEICSFFYFSGVLIGSRSKVDMYLEVKHISSFRC